MLNKNLETSSLEEDAYVFSLYYNAALREDINAQYQIGFMYYIGLGVMVCKEEALYWFQKAAYHGHVEAQYYLALMYDIDPIYGYNLELAKYWYQKAAVSGDKDACFALSALYKGIGDLRRSIYWKKKGDRLDIDFQIMSTYLKVEKKPSLMQKLRGMKFFFSIKNSFKKTV